MPPLDPAAEAAMLDAVTAELAELGEQVLKIELRPFDAFTVVGLLQFAARTPSLSPTQIALLETAGRGLQRAVGSVAPLTAALLERGWDRSLDLAVRRPQA